MSRIATSATALALIIAWVAWMAAGWLVARLGLTEFELLAQGGAVLIALGRVDRVFARLTPTKERDSS